MQNLNRPVLFRFDLFKIIIGNNHIFVLVIFKALNNIFVCNFLAASWVAVYKARGI